MTVTPSEERQHISGRVRISGDRLRRCREARGLSAQGLAGMMGHGSSAKSVEHWEENKWSPTAATVLKMAKVLKTTPAYLTGLSEKMERHAGDAGDEPAPVVQATDGARQAIPAPARPRNIDTIDGSVLKALRVRRTWTRRHLSELTGINYASIESWENRRYEGCGREKAGHIAKVLGVPLEVLAGLWPIPDYLPAVETCRDFKTVEAETVRVEPVLSKSVEDMITPPGLFMDPAHFLITDKPPALPPPVRPVQPAPPVQPVPTPEPAPEPLVAYDATALAASAAQLRGTADMLDGLCARVRALETENKQLARALADQRRTFKQEAQALVDMMQEKLSTLDDDG